MNAFHLTGLVRYSVIASVLAFAMLPAAGCRPPKSELSSRAGGSGQGNDVSENVDPDAGENSTGKKDIVVPAVPGVGKQGQGLRDRTGYLSTVGSAYFDAKQRIEFEIKIPHAMNLFKAEHGRLPKTEEEFFEKIIKFNQINLPELPEGHSYFYDTETGLLMVRQPIQENEGE